MLNMAPDCSGPAVVPESGTVPANQLCAGYDTNVFCKVTQDAAAMLSEVRTKWPGKAWFLYVQFGQNTGREGDPKAVEEFFAQVQRVMTVLLAQPDRHLQERSFKKIDAAKQEMKNLIAQQQTKLENARSNALQALVDGLKSKIDADRAPIVEQLDQDRAFYPVLTKALENVDGQLSALAPAFKSLIQEYKDFKANEQGLRDSLNQLSARASAANADQIVQVDADLRSLEQDQTGKYSQFFAHATDLNAKLRAVQTTYSGYIWDKRLAQDMTDRGLFEADLVSGASRAVGNMVAYAHSRDIQMSQVVSRLITGCWRRREALVLAQADAATRKSVADAAYLAAAGTFLDEANAKIATLLAARPTSPKLKLPFYSKQHDDFMNFLQLEPACAQAAIASTSWMQTGCNALSSNFDKARLFLNNLPNYIKLNIPTLRANGVPEDMLTQIANALAANNLRSAVSTYDAALRLVDGG